jgi:hypothetical protein
MAVVTYNSQYANLLPLSVPYLPGIAVYYSRHANALSTVFSKADQISTELASFYRIQPSLWVEAFGVRKYAWVAMHDPGGHPYNRLQDGQ